MQTRKRIISIRREIHTDDKRLIRTLNEAINYRRFLYNMGVEYIRGNEGRFNSDDKRALYGMIREHERNDAKYPDKPVGIRAMVMRDLKEAHDRVMKSWCNNEHAALQFKRYNSNSGSFKVENKSRHKADCGWSTVSIVGNDCIRYKANKRKDFINTRMHHYDIHLKEPIVCGIDLQNRMYDKTKRYRFSNSDIREVIFLRKNKKYYIIIVVEVEFILKSDGSRKPLAGLDLGIHNPITIYDGLDFGKYRFSKKVLLRLERLESRIAHLNSILDRKRSRNISRGMLKPSKNYKRVLRKLRRSWEKITNIRTDWRFKLAHAIVTNYDCIVVDKFRQPDNSELLIGSKTVAKINHDNRLHAMYLFTETLEYMAYKYGCEFIDAPSGTTRTCSECGYVNDKLPLHRRKLTCDRCGTKIDRDENAAKNCYMYGLAR